MRLVIVGMGTGGLFTALTAARLERSLQVVLVERKGYELLHPCGLPFVIEGRAGSGIKGTFPDMGFEKMLNTSAVGANFAAKKIYTDSGQEIPYDRLVIATGSGPVVPDIPGLSDLLGKSAFVLDSWDSAVALQKHAAKTAVVLGAGAIGLEAACALRRKGIEVTLVEAKDHVLPHSLDADMAGVVEEHLKQLGIRLMLGRTVESFQGSLEGFVCKGSLHKAGLAVVAAGTRPNTGWLKGIETGELGIIVNDRMQTSAPDVYAVGDCVQTVSLVDGRKRTMQLAVAAMQQGIVAGRVIAGKKASYSGCLNTFATELAGLEVSATGLLTSEKEAVFGRATASDTAEWCTGRRDVTVKVLCDSAGRLTGAQAVGANAPHRINVAAAALRARMSVWGLAACEHAYCPALSQTYDALMQAADNAIRKLEAK